MCRKFVLASRLETIEERFNAKLAINYAEQSGSYSVSPGDQSYVITGQDPHLLQVFKFGMTPHYSEEPMNLINARSEGDKNQDDQPGYNGSKSIFLKTAFKKPIQSQRCLLIADAYYEWTDQFQTYLVFLRNKNRPFALAGIYDEWKNRMTGEIVFSFAIITTTANSMLQCMGVKRMPVILSRSNETEWIKPSNHLSDVLPLLSAYPSEKMNAYPVSEMVNRAGENDATMLNPIGERVLNESNPTYATGNRSFHKKLPPTDQPWFKSINCSGS